MLSWLYRMKEDERGFTLIELMVVVAIILILVIFLFPALLAARRRANDSITASYLREAATYQEMYNVDNNSYTGAAGDLTALGLKPIPVSVTFTILGGGVSGYCMSAFHALGTVGTTFYSNPNGLSRGTACTYP